MDSILFGLQEHLISRDYVIIASALDMFDIFAGQSVFRPPRQNINGD
jgi:hypothetical protein